MIKKPRGSDFELKRFMQWPQTKQQCMMRIGTPSIRCLNEAKFTIGFRNGEAQDVCRDCLATACEMTNDEVVVMKLRSR